MSHRTDLGGPVSAALEADLRAAVRRKGLIYWLDPDGAYSAFVDRLAAARAANQLPYEVRALRGSYLDLMFALEFLAGGVEPAPLLIHLPGLNDETVKATPLLELCSAGTRYQRALPTLVAESAAGRARPERVAAFQAQPDLTVEGADLWLAALLDQQEDGLAAQLRTLPPAVLLDDLLGGGPVAAQLKLAADQGPLWERLSTLLGLPSAWREQVLPATQPSAEDIAACAAGWALCVEYVDDLKRPPVGASLQPALGFPRGVTQGVFPTCRALAVHLRERHPDFYQRTAFETEAFLGDEIEAARAEDLGQIDTFRFEESKVLDAALLALAQGAFDDAAAWAAGRAAGASFWVKRSVERGASWQLIAAAAALGQAIARAGDLGARSLEQALSRYVQVGAAVDQAHRHLEQRRAVLLYPQIVKFGPLRERLDALRATWRAWADGWARDFNELCRRDGFLPPPARQQRTLFEDVVRPLTQEPGTTALFLVDALRFEMAEELFRELKDSAGTTAALGARLAELPTVTEVGMNALAPLSSGGRLRPVLDAGGAVQGFSAGEYRVADLEARSRAMHQRVGGDTSPRLSLDEVLSRDATSLRRAVARARLLIVHSQEIDSAGEKGVGPVVFDNALQRLRAAWRLLREADVRRFVVTADHGFLLDEGERAVQAHGRKSDPRRRHVFSPVAADHDGEVRVALADLGYEGAPGHLMFPLTTAAFDTGRRGTSFVHGGNSLQERVIPVLTLSHRGAPGASSLAYAVTARACDPVAGMHCLELCVEVCAQHALPFGSPREIELALRAPEHPDIQVELCQTRGAARVQGASLLAAVGAPVELFFRLSGAVDTRARVEIFHPGKAEEVTPCVPEARFAVTAARVLESIAAVAPVAAAAPTPATADPPATAAAPPPQAPAAPPLASWLLELPEGGVRKLFQHLAQHGSVTEEQAVALLGSPRALRSFCLRVEELARKAPFTVRTLTIAGIKRFEREGS